MDPDQAAVTAAYLEHLTDGDVALLAAATEEDAPAREWRATLRSRRGGMEDLFQRPLLFEAVLGAPESGDPLIGVSPFLAFAVAVHRTARDLARVAAPALALALHWGSWDRVLTLGLRAARELASAADEAYFTHEHDARRQALGDTVRGDKH